MHSVFNCNKKKRIELLLMIFFCGLFSFYCSDAINETVYTTKSKKLFFSTVISIMGRSKSTCLVSCAIEGSVLGYLIKKNSQYCKENKACALTYAIRVGMIGCGIALLIDAHLLLLKTQWPCARKKDIHGIFKSITSSYGSVTYDKEYDRSICSKFQKNKELHLIFSKELPPSLQFYCPAHVGLDVSTRTWSIVVNENIFDFFPLFTWRFIIRHELVHCFEGPRLMRYKDWFSFCSVGEPQNLFKDYLSEHMADKAAICDSTMATNDLESLKKLLTIAYGIKWCFDFFSNPFKCVKGIFVKAHPMDIDHEAFFTNVLAARAGKTTYSGHPTIGMRLYLIKSELNRRNAGHASFDNALTMTEPELLHEEIGSLFTYIEGKKNSGNKKEEEAAVWFLTCLQYRPA